MKKLIALSLLFALAINVNAQNGVEPVERTLKTILQRPYFSFGMQIGSNNGLTVLDSGSLALSTQSAKTISGVLSYNYPLSLHSSLSASVGVGALPYRMYNSAFRSDSWAAYLVSQRASLAYNYRLIHSARSFSNISMSYTIMRPQQMGISTSSSAYIDTVRVIEWEGSRSAGIKYEPIGQLFGFSIEHNRLLPNNDLVGFAIGYRHGFTNALIFNYTAFNKQGEASKGRYINRGTEFYCGLSYSMTNYKKNETKSALAKADKREALKNRKKELEKYRSNSLKIEAGAASNFFKERFQDQRINVNALSGPGLTLYTDLAIEQPDYSIHMGLQYHEIWETNKVRGQQWYGSSGVDYAAQINFGLGKSITNRAKTKRLVTVVGSVGLIGSSFGESRGTSGYGDTLLVISENNGGVRISPVLTLAANSSLRLYNQLYFNYGVQMSQGFLPISRSSINYELTQSDNWSTNKKMNGSSLLLKFGLAFHLNNGL